MATILYTSNKIRSAITDLFSRSKGRRVAVVGFVGDKAESYLPKAKGIELICWPKAGGTNPNTLRILEKGGVKINFADSLHMKLYWTEDLGAIITSANLSTNALGAGNLKEIGVKLPQGHVDIQKVLSTLTMRPMETSELRRLDRAHDLLVAKQAFKGGQGSSVSFRDWFHHSKRKQIKLICWDEEPDFTEFANLLAMEEYGLASPESHFLLADDDSLKAGDWVLSFRWAGIRISKIGWLFVDKVVKLPRADPDYSKELPYEAIQFSPLKTYSPPPFKLDKKFKMGLKKAASKYGTDRYEEISPNAMPSKSFLKVLEAYCR